MDLTLGLLIGWAKDLEKAKWSGEFEGEVWSVSDVDFDFMTKNFRFECNISKDDVKHSIVAIENYEGGGDTLEIDGEAFSADHHVSLKKKLKFGLPPKIIIKVKFKSEYDVDEEPGYEKILRLWCKIRL